MAKRIQHSLKVLRHCCPDCVNQYQLSRLRLSSLFRCLIAFETNQSMQQSKMKLFVSHFCSDKEKNTNCQQYLSDIGMETQVSIFNSISNSIHCESLGSESISFCSLSKRYLQKHLSLWIKNLLQLLKLLPIMCSIKLRQEKIKSTGTVSNNVILSNNDTVNVYELVYLLAAKNT